MVNAFTAGGKEEVGKRRSWEKKKEETKRADVGDAAFAGLSSAGAF
jgi:hypothetical protein